MVDKIEYSFLDTYTGKDFYKHRMLVNAESNININTFTIHWYLKDYNLLGEHCLCLI